MNINEMQILKRKIESSINDLLNNFSTVTNLDCTSIEVKPIHRMGASTQYLTKLEIKL